MYIVFISVVGLGLGVPRINISYIFAHNGNRRNNKGYIQKDVPWCMLFVDDIAFVDTSKESLHAKLVTRAKALQSNFNNE